jgi:DNA polymerase
MVRENDAERRDPHPIWRQKLEAFRRAGFEHLPLRRLKPPELVSTPSTQAPGPNLGSASTFEPTGAPVLSPNTVSRGKEAALAVIANEVAECQRCEVLCASRSRTVFSDGTPNAELCFVGEAPGAEEDRTGLPFVGDAGKLLTRIIEACRLRRDEVYICNVLKCRPPGNRNPEWQEMQNCRPYLERQLDLVAPKALVALGKFAAAFLLDRSPDKVAITRMRGEWHEFRGIPVMLTYHPAYLLRNPDAKRDVWTDMKEVMRRIGKPVD